MAHSKQKITVYLEQGTYKDSIINAITFQERLSSFDLNKCSCFYKKLSHSITISIRVIIHEDCKDESQKIQAIKLLNEILHRSIQKIEAESYGCNEHSNFFTFSSEIVSKSNMATQQFEFCLSKAFNIAT